MAEMYNNACIYYFSGTGNARFAAQNISNGLIEKGISQDPTYDFTSADGVQHTFWVVSDAAFISQLETEIKESVQCSLK